MGSYREYVGGGGRVVVEKDYMLSGESNIIGVGAQSSTSHNYLRYSVSVTNTPTEDFTVTITINGVPYVFVGYVDEDDVDAQGFYGKYNVLENLQAAIEDNTSVSGYLNCEISNRVLYIAQKAEGKKIDFEVEADSPISVTLNGSTSWTDSLGDSDTVIELRLYDKSRETPRGILSPCAVLSKYYTGKDDTMVDFELADIMKYYTSKSGNYMTETEDIHYEEPFKHFSFDVVAVQGVNTRTIVSHFDAEDILVQRGKIKDRSNEFEDYTLTSESGMLMTNVWHRVWNTEDSGYVDYVSYAIRNAISSLNIMYKYYTSDGYLISTSDLESVVKDSSHANMTISVKVEPDIPEGCAYFYVGLTGSGTEEYMYEAVKYEVVSKWNESRKLMYLSSLGAREIIDFCGNENLETKTRTGSWTAYTKSMVPDDWVTEKEVIFRSGETDNYVLRSGVMPRDTVEAYTYELCNSEDIRVLDEHGAWRPVVLTSLEQEFNTKTANGLIEIEYHYAN